jgi:hypothetical protein
MNSKTFLGLVWVLLLSFSAETAAAFPKLQMQPIELVGYIGKAIRVAVTIPCGGEFYGIIASTNEKKKTMALAAAVSQDSIVCTSMPSQREVVIDYLDVTGFKSIEPMIVGGNPRISIARISDLKMVRSKNSGNRLKVVYEPKCGRSIGTLIRQSEKQRLEIAMVEKPRSGEVAGSCAGESAEKVITAIDTSARKKVGALQSNVKSLSRQYELKMVPINPKGIKTGKNGGISFSYRKGCNDAPVGVVVSSEKNIRGEKTALIGMLVANYYNIPCVGKLGKSTLAEHKDSTILIPSGTKVALFNPSELNGLVVKAPTRISKEGSTGRKNIVLKHSASCNQVIGGVYSRDAQGGISVGILTAGDDSSDVCKSAASDVSLLQPYFIGHLRMETLYPLKLKGQTSR